MKAARMRTFVFQPTSLQESIQVLNSLAKIEKNNEKLWHPSPTDFSYVRKYGSEELMASQCCNDNFNDVSLFFHRIV